MPSTNEPTVCFICNENRAQNNICKHLMTHTTSLKEYIEINAEPYATIKDKQNRGEYYCCFGCKKAYKDRNNLRNHMKISDNCRVVHTQFLKDIGVQVEKVQEAVKEEAIKENYLLKMLRDENFSLKDQLQKIRDENPFQASIDSLEKTVHQLQKSNRYYEECFRLIPRYMDTNLLSYCNNFLQLYKNISTVPDGEERARRRREMIHLINTTPLLQLYFIPSIKHIMNTNVAVGNYEGINCGFLELFDYKPTEFNTYLDVDAVPPLPNWSERDKRMVQQLMKSDVPQESTKPELSYNNMKLISNSKK